MVPHCNRKPPSSVVTGPLKPKSSFVPPLDMGVNGAESRGRGVRVVPFILFALALSSIAEGDFAVPGSGGGKCGSEASSVECCGNDVGCRADFKCHRNNCAFNSCDPNAECTPGKEPNT